MNIDKIEKNLRLKGFSKGQAKILTDEELHELNQLILENFRKEDSNQTIFDLLGKNVRIDEIFEKIINNNEIQEVLKKTCGKDFMLWRPRLRIAKNNDRGLEIHQDSIGCTKKRGRHRKREKVAKILSNVQRVCQNYVGFSIFIDV